MIWSTNKEVAFFERTGGHDELFGKVVMAYQLLEWLALPDQATAQYFIM